MSNSIRRSPVWSGWRRAFALTVVLVATVAPSRAQQPNTETSQSQASPTPTPAPALTPSELPERVLAGQRLLRELRPLAAADDDLTVDETGATEARAAVERLHAGLDGETARTTSRRALDDMKAQALRIRAWTRSRQDEIGSRVAQTGAAVGRLVAETTAWRATRSELWFGDLPASLSERVRDLEVELEALAIELEDRLGALLELQTSLWQIEARLDQLFESLDTESTARARDMFAIDTPPFWRFLGEPQNLDGLGRQIAGAASASIESTRTYLEQNHRTVGAQLLAWLALVALLELSRRRTRAGREQAEFGPALAILRRPAAAALLLVVTVGQILLNRDAPSAWQDLISLLILVGAARLLPILLPPPMRRVLYGLTVLAAMHWLAHLVSERLPIDRLLWLAVSLAGALVLPRLGAWTMAAVGDAFPRLGAAERLLARVAAVALAVATIANLLGAFTLSTEITQAALVSLYLSVLMWTLTEIVDGLVVLLLESTIGRRLRVLRDNGARVRSTIGRVAGVLAIAAWAAGTAAEIGVLWPTLRVLRTALTASMTAGQITLSAGVVLLFALVLWLAVQASRLVRFVLNEEVFSRVELPQGAPAALSSLTHYGLVILGFLVAVAAVGLDLTHFALVAGALGVGIGFGLQTVVNNFISGLILLFERPIRVGDRVEIGTMSGTVTAIGIRASTVRTWDGAEVVVPNGTLLESELVNWTLSDATRRIEVRVGVAYGTDPERVLPLLVAAATTHPKVLTEPEPIALFVGFGDSSLDFGLRAWCQFGDTLEVRSDLHVAVNRALAEAGIEIPFPQRDVHVRNLPT